MSESHGIRIGVVEVSNHRKLPRLSVRSATRLDPAT